MTRMCCVCHKVEQAGEWMALGALTKDERVTHGYCPVCFVGVMTELENFISEKAIRTPGASCWPKLHGPCNSCV